MSTFGFPLINRFFVGTVAAGVNKLPGGMKFYLTNRNLI